jgi:hypothetical protein
MSIQSRNRELAAFASKIISIEPTSYRQSPQQVGIDNLECGGDGPAWLLEKGTLIPVGGTSSLIHFC